MYTSWSGRNASTVPRSKVAKCPESGATISNTGSSGGAARALEMQQVAPRAAVGNLLGHGNVFTADPRKGVAERRLVETLCIMFEMVQRRGRQPPQRRVPQRIAGKIQQGQGARGQHPHRLERRPLQLVVLIEHSEPLCDSCRITSEKQPLQARSFSAPVPRTGGNTEGARGVLVPCFAHGCHSRISLRCRRSAARDAGGAAELHPGHVSA